MRIRAWREGSNRVLQERELLAILDQCRQIQLSGDRAFPRAGLGDRRAARAQHLRAAGVGEVGILAATVHADDVALVLDGAGPEQRDPMLLAYGRPTSDHRQYLRPAQHGGTKKLWESQVVADERRDPKALPIKNENLTAGGVMLRLASGNERMDLLVAQRRAAIRKGDKRLVAPAPIGPAAGNAGDDANVKFVCEGQKKLLGFPAGYFRDLAGGHAETGGEHLGQHHQRSGRNGDPSQNRAKLGIVGRLVVPGDVKLDSQYVHRQSIVGVWGLGFGVCRALGSGTTQTPNPKLAIQSLLRFNDCACQRVAIAFAISITSVPHLELFMTQRVRHAAICSAALATAAFLAAPALSPGKGRPRSTNGPIPAEETVDSFTVAPGLKTTVWATEPGMVNPTNMDIDARGRVWVTEAANYRSSKTRPEGDRIVIMEDTKHTGQADSYKVFVQDKQLFAPLGICVLGNKVIVSQSPNVLVYTIDASGDHAAGPPQVFFTGFGGVNHDHGVHAGIFGPDGRFYFNCGNEGDHSQLFRYGDYVKSQDGAPVVDITGSQIGQDAKIWHGHPRQRGQGYREGLAMSCNLDGSDFEVLGYNFRNNYELTVDSFGTVWQSDNDDDGNQGVRINYVMEGGNYGYTGPNGSNWGRDAQQYKSAFPNQTKPEQHWHLRWPGVVPNLLNTGAGAPCGICIYEGDLLPEPYRNALLHCDAGPNIVRAYITRPGIETPAGFFKPVSADEALAFKKKANPNAGAGFEAAAVELVKGGDKWFRPDDICVAPDGAVYISDWYDPGVGGHATGDTGAHEGAGGWKKLHGRIYRLAPDGYKPTATPKIDLDNTAGQIAALNSPNLATRYLGYSKLLGAIGEDATVNALKEQFASNSNPRLRARALWLLSRSKNGADLVREGLKDKNANIRVAAFRAARKIKMNVPDLASQVLQDPAPAMWREMCLALQFDNDNAKVLPLLVKLADKYDGKDRWYLEAIGIAANGRQKETLAAWEKDHQNKDPRNNEGILWRLKEQPVQLGGPVSEGPAPNGPPPAAQAAVQGGAGPFADDNGVAAPVAHTGSESWPAVVTTCAADQGIGDMPLNEIAFVPPQREFHHGGTETLRRFGRIQHSSLRQNSIRRLIFCLMVRRLERASV